MIAMLKTLTVPFASPAAAIVLLAAAATASTPAGRLATVKQRLAVRHVPDAERLVVRARDDLGPILRHRHRLDGARVTGERPDYVPVVHVEHLDRLVGRRREKLRPVRDERPR